VPVPRRLATVCRAVLFFPKVLHVLKPLYCFMQVGTQDGRVKVIGETGVEALLLDQDKSASRDLQFLHGKGAIANITQGPPPPLLSPLLPDSPPAYGPGIKVQVPFYGLGMDRSNFNG